MSRPTVSVVVPFAGDVADAGSMLDALAQLRTAPGDEILVVDNSPKSSIAVAEHGPLRVLRAIAERSSYHARNAGAAATSGEWLLFTDSDCLPTPNLLDKYFEPVPGARCGALAGEILGHPGQHSLTARWARARSRLGQRWTLAHPFRPYGSTANLLVRRVAFDELCGFAEGIRSGGDADLCWRLVDAGFSVELREDAYVWHHHPETVRGLLRQGYRYGGAQTWLERRYPGCSPPGSSAPRFLAAKSGEAVALALRGQLEEAAFRGLDIASFVAEGAGHKGSNRPPPAA